MSDLSIKNVLIASLNVVKLRSTMMSVAVKFIEMLNVSLQQFVVSRDGSSKSCLSRLCWITLRLCTCLYRVSHPRLPLCLTNDWARMKSRFVSSLHYRWFVDNVTSNQLGYLFSDMLTEVQKEREIFERGDSCNRLLVNCEI